MFDFLRRHPAEHLKRAHQLLREAHLSRMEHQAAAEHHAALAEMYTLRVARLEREIDAARTESVSILDPAPAGARVANVHHYPFNKLEGG